MHCYWVIWTMHLKTHFLLCYVHVYILSTSYVEFMFYLQRQKSFEDSYKQSDFRYILFSGNATAVWEISPPARAALQDFLQQNESVYVPLIFSWKITRYLCMQTPCSVWTELK